MNKVNIRLMKESDLDNVLLIENESFKDKWGRKHYLYELNENPFSVLYILEKDSLLIGYLVFMITFHSASISKIAIKKEYRKLNYASLLMNQMIKHLLEIHDETIEVVTLEVRVSNIAAINFYKKHHFEIILTKPQYYQDGEDAYYMIRRLL